MSAWKLLRVYQSAGGVFIAPVSFAIVFQVCYPGRLPIMTVSHGGVCQMNSAGNCYFCAIQDRMDSMKRFYRYMIYRLYDKALKKPSAVPVMDTITALAALHTLMFFVFVELFYTFVMHANSPLWEHMGLMIFFVIFNLWVHYILFYDSIL